MKKVLLALALLFAAANVHASTVDTYMTSNTVSYNTVGLIVTFNTVVNHLKITNEGDEELYITFANIGWTNKGDEYLLPRTQKTSIYTTQPVVRLLPISDANAKTSVFEVDFSTDRIGFITDSGSGTVSYTATADREQP